MTIYDFFSIDIPGMCTGMVRIKYHGILAVVTPNLGGIAGSRRLQTNRSLTDHFVLIFW